MEQAPEAPLAKTAPGADQPEPRLGPRKEVSQMGKKLITGCMAIVAIGALTIAPSASATTLTESGVPLKAGASVTYKNTGFWSFLGSFNVSCSSTDLTGTVVVNATSIVKVNIPVGNSKLTGTGTSEDCTSALGSVGVTVNSQTCIETAAGDVVKTTGCGANVVFTLTITGTGPCKYSTASISGTFTTNESPASETVSEQEAKLSEGGFFCPSAGKINEKTDTYTTGGTTPLTFS